MGMKKRLIDGKWVFFDGVKQISAAQYYNITKETTLIKNRNLVKQVLDFTGLQNKKIHPSDIDFVLEFDDEVLILGEVKHKYNKIPTGQRLILERIIDKWGHGGIAIKVEHNFENENQNIPLHLCFVTSRYYSGHWKYFKKPPNIVDYLNEIGKHFNCEKCKL